MESFKSDAQTVLREQLKVALRDAKQLFDDNLLDETEYKDLKANELSKYKEKLAALVPGEGSTTPTMSSPFTVPRGTRISLTPMTTPTTAGGSLPPRVKHLHSATKSEPSFTPSPHPNAATPRSLTPRTATPLKKSGGKAQHEFEACMDPIHALRLSTPPIFRRRAVRKRRITVPSAEIASLNRIREPTMSPKPS